MEIALLAFCIFLVNLLAVTHIYQSEHCDEGKAVWSVVVTALPVIGAMLWLTIGNRLITA